MPAPRNDRVDQILLILTIENREAARITERVSVPAQHAVANGVKRSAPKAARVHRQQVRDPIEHLARGFIRESKEQNISRIDPVLEQVSDAICQRPRLAAARARDHEQGARRSRHRRELLLVQIRRVIDADRGRGRGALKRVLPGHRR